MPNKIVTIRVQNKRIGAQIQKLCFRYGFKWNDGLASVRDCGENKNFFLEIDFSEGTIKYLAPFMEPEIFVAFKNNYDLENEFDVPDEIKAFKDALIRNRKELTVQNVSVNESPKPKYPVVVLDKNNKSPYSKEKLNDIFGTL